MSTEEHKDTAHEPDASTGGLESGADVGRQPERPAGKPDLDAEALAAAVEAIARGERALRELPPGVLPDPAVTRSRRRRETALRTMLLLNLVLMGVMLALPDPGPPDPGPAAQGSGTPGGGVDREPPDPPPAAALDPEPEPPRENRTGQARPRADLWSRALVLFGEGSYGEAADQLMAFERMNPQMPEGQKLDLYTMISSCLFKAGRMEEASRYRAKARTLMGRGYLPEDLRNAAASAWDDGRYDEARRYYSRFLLQQKQLPADLREAVAEAYLRIGDSYRMAAEVRDQERGR